MSTSNNAICTFKENAPLRNFLCRKAPQLGSSSDNKYQYAEVQNALNKIIEEEQLFDETNPAIVLCSKDLEEALNVKAFHISELKYYLSKQFLYIKCEELDNAEAATTASLSPEGNNTSSHLHPEGQSSSSSLNSKIEGSFIISQELRDTFSCLRDFKKEQLLFEYSEILSYLSKYIIKNRDKFFDPRNVKVAFIENDPLEKAFKTKTFHRIQVTALLDREINRVPTISDVKVEDLTSREDHEVPVPEPPLFDHEHPSTSVQKRKLNREGEVSEEKPGCSGSSPKRVRRLSTYTVSILGYESTDEETIYSAQGYETVAMSERSKSEYMSSSDSSDDEDEMVYSAEYEINDEDDMNPSQKNTDSSDEDSELDDVVLKVTVFDLMEEENEFWADSESDLDEDLEYEDGTKSDLKCCKCGEQTKIILLYCERCWQERKESCPKRENPRKKRRSNKLKPLPSVDLMKSDEQSELKLRENSKKKVVPSYLRSMSNTSSCSSSCSGAHHYESQDSGVGSQEGLFSEKSPDVSSEENDSEGIYTPLKKFRSSNDCKVRNDSYSGCSFCFRRPKNATLIHGNIGHTICCYPCAKKLWKNQRPCPICRRKIEKFVLNIEA